MYWSSRGFFPTDQCKTSSVLRRREIQKPAGNRRREMKKDTVDISGSILSWKQKPGFQTVWKLLVPGWTSACYRWPARCVEEYMLATCIWYLKWRGCEQLTEVKQTLHMKAWHSEIQRLLKQYANQQTEYFIHFTKSTSRTFLSWFFLQ